MARNPARGRHRSRLASRPPECVLGRGEALAPYAELVSALIDELLHASAADSFASVQIGPRVDRQRVQVGELASQVPGLTEFVEQLARLADQRVHVLLLAIRVEDIGLG